MIEDKDHAKMVESNTWFDLDQLDEIIRVIKVLASKKVYSPEENEIPGNNYWSWVKNTQCKYIDLRIDMRDGGFVLLNRDGQRISLKQLQWQYGQEKENG